MNFKLEAATWEIKSVFLRLLLSNKFLDKAWSFNKIKHKFLSKQELIDAFSLERVSKHGAKFDQNKAKWFNHQYLMKQSDESLAEAFVKNTSDKNILSNFSFVEITKIVSLIKERAHFVSEFTGG